MDPFSIVNNILNVAKSLSGFRDRLKEEDQAQRERISRLFDAIGDCLIAVCSEIRAGTVPYGRCSELVTYDHELPDLISGKVGEEKANELGSTLYSAYNVEGMAIDLSEQQDKEPYLQKIDEAAGKFKALANLLLIK